MINIEIENEILDYIKNKKTIFISKFDNKWKKYLLQRYNDCNNIYEAFFRLKNNIEIHPKCVICGKPAKFYGMKNYIFANTCGSSECKGKLISNSLKSIPNNVKQQIKKKVELTKLNKYGDKNFNNRNKYQLTCLEKYGVDNVAKSNKAKDKYHQTCLQKYGVENFYQSNSFKQKSKLTKIKKYNNENYTNRKLAVLHTNYQNVLNKAKQTKLEKYGNEWYSNIEKAKQTKLEKYGDEWYSNIEKAKQTKLEKYGDEWYSNIEKAKQTKLEKYGDAKYNNKEKTKNTCLEKYHVNCSFQSKIAIEKSQKTCLEKYGNKIWSKSKIGHEIISKNMRSEIIQNKIIETKKINGTLNSSKTENQAYELIKEKYSDIIRQYKSEKYPFNCDFYIPSLDLYIECQFGQFHHHRPYLNTEQDKNDIEELKRKSNIIKQKTKRKITRYDNEIETWVIRDVKKRKIAKENNLNYLELWNLNEVRKWINSI